MKKLKKNHRGFIMDFRSIAILLLAIVHYSLCDEHAKDNPVTRYLKLKPNARHEFINIELPERSKRAIVDEGMLPAGTRLQILAFGENITLWLYPSDSVLASKNTPIYYSRYSPNSPSKVNITQHYRMWNWVARVMEDRAHRASMIFGKDEYGRPRVNGRIESRRLGIRYLPRNVVRAYARQRRSVDLSGDNFSNSMNHVVYEIDEEFERDHPIAVINETLLRSRMARSTEEIPSAIYPKVLVVVDSSVLNAHGRYIDDLLEYILIFMNGIDLKYRALENPSIRFFIAGILVGVDYRSLPYISKNEIDRRTFNANRAINDAKRFFYEIKNSIPVSSYDISLTLTSLAFGLGDEARVVGKALPFTICHDPEEHSTVDAIAFIMDNGGFSGVYYAAHELAHILGAGHDLDESDACSYENGFIMSAFVIQTRNSSMFSDCSIADLQKYLDKGQFSCMYKKPRVSNRQKFPRLLLPGRTKNVEKLCAKEKLGKPCHDANHPDTCVKLFCTNSAGECVVTDKIALEGMVCDSKNGRPQKYCIHNECVSV